MKAKRTMAVALAAGCLCGIAAADDARQTARVDLSHRVHGAEIKGYIYHHVASGVTIASPAPTARADESQTVWQTTDTDMGCGFGFFFGISDDDQDPEVDPAFWSFPDDRGHSWGDVPADTLVDCFVVAYATNLLDDDPSGAGAGAPAGRTDFNVNLTIFDDDNGFGDIGRQLLGTVSVTDVPGHDGTAGAFSGWILTLDFSPEVVFQMGTTEPCDPDSIFCNEDSFSDQDDDGLHDFGFDYQFDNPGNPDGSGVDIAGPFLTLPDPVLGTGSEDAFDIWEGDGTSYVGTFFFGGYDPVACQNPWSDFYLELLGPNGDDPFPGCSPADLAPPFGVLDIFDVIEFLTLFENEDPLADLAPPFGVWDIFDVIEFLSIFEEGCP